MYSSFDAKNIIKSRKTCGLNQHKNNVMLSKIQEQKAWDES